MMLILLPIVFFALLQGAFLPLNLLLLTLVIWMAFTYDSEENSQEAAAKIYLVAFLSGIFLDLTTVSFFGSHALVFLLLSVLFLLYGRSFAPTRPWFLAGFVFFADIILSFLRGNFDLLNSQRLALVTVAILVGGIFSYLMGGGSQVRLKK